MATIIYVLSCRSGSETAMYDQHVRERHLVQRARAEGHHAQLWIIGFGTKPCPHPDDDNAWYFPADPDTPGNARDLVSTAMLEQIQTLQPDLIIFKGMGYRLNSWLVEHSDHPFRYAFIVGGGARDIAEPEAGFVLAETPAQLRRHFRRRVAADTAEIFPKVVAPQDFQQSTDHEFDIISVGSLIDRKNHVALAPLCANYRVAIIGAGHTDAAIRRAAERVGASPPYLPGAVPRSEIPRLIARSRLMVHPSLNEGFPRVFAEAFACGVPVVALRRGIAGGLPNPDVGLLVSERELIPTVHRVLSDPAELERRGRAALRYAQEHYSVDAAAQVLNNVYRLLLDCPPTPEEWRRTRRRVAARYHPWRIGKAAIERYKTTRRSLGGRLMRARTARDGQPDQSGDSP